MNYSYLIISILFLFSSCSEHIGTNEIDNLNDQPISIEARFMQYACGDWNDDVQINSVNDSVYSFLNGKDVDPVIFNGDTQLKGWFYHNRTQENGFNFIMEGYVSECAEYGCEGGAPKFWITEITRADGSTFHMPEDQR